MQYCVTNERHFSVLMLYYSPAPLAQKLSNGDLASGDNPMQYGSITLVQIHYHGAAEKGAYKYYTEEL